MVLNGILTSTRINDIYTIFRAEKFNKKDSWLQFSVSFAEKH